MSREKQSRSPTQHRGNAFFSGALARLAFCVVGGAACGVPVQKGPEERASRREMGGEGGLETAREKAKELKIKEKGLGAEAFPRQVSPPPLRV